MILVYKATQDIKNGDIIKIDGNSMSEQVELVDYAITIFFGDLTWDEVREMTHGKIYDLTKMEVDYILNCLKLWTADSRDNKSQRLIFMHYFSIAEYGLEKMVNMSFDSTVYGKRYVQHCKTLNKEK